MALCRRLCPTAGFIRGLLNPLLNSAFGPWTPINYPVHENRDRGALVLSGCNPGPLRFATAWNRQTGATAGSAARRAAADSTCGIHGRFKNRFAMHRLWRWPSEGVVAYGRIALVVGIVTKLFRKMPLSPRRGPPVSLPGRRPTSGIQETSSGK